MTEAIHIQDFIDKVKQGIALLDVRSPKEYLGGHIPGAISLPLLNDDERHEVGLSYKNQGRYEAVILGYRLVGHKFVAYIEAARALAVDGKVCLYCWRGGIRSNTMAWLLSSVGMEVYLLEGGYKEYRRWCLSQFEHRWPIMVLSGKTGAGKTEILHELRNRGEAIIDFEAFACHRGSSFGGLGLPMQPTQEAFENAVAWELGAFHSARRIWMENESRFIGRVRIPDALFEQSNQAALVSIDRAIDYRAERILAEYGRFDKQLLEEKTKSITKRMGGDRVKVSLDALHVGDMMGWVMPLLDYYDRNYDHSVQMRKGKYESILEVNNQTPSEIADILLRLQPH
jgi:tRNA 2-selenouridine synthase